ncbi:hypothetical protein Bpfe_029350, partial [Biomphalaria pfeifferi]
KESHQNDVMVHKEKVSHFENKNGEKVKVEEKEEKVVDAKTGHVIADVKQEVKQEATGNSKPETIVKTKIDIPSEDVHETFVQEGTDPSKDIAHEEQDLEPELTPADMAEYLYLTQQFDAFYAALDRLVNQSKMTSEDAQNYAKSVALQYQKLQIEDYEDKVLAEKRMYPRYPVDLEQVPIVDMESQSGPGYAAADRYAPAELFGYPSQAEEQYLAQSQDFGGDINLYDFLAALWNEAYGKGNEEAKEIVRMLYERVSQDNNPDDIGQIRDILVDTVAASLNEKPYNVRPNDVISQTSALKNARPVEALKETPKEKVKEEALKKVEENIVQEVKEEIKEAKAEKQAEAKAEQQKQ